MDGLQVGHFKPPPDGFDPLAASERELLRHGYPARPPEDLLPALGERWEHVVSRSKQFALPEFAPVPVEPDGAAATGSDNALGSGWAGSMAPAPVLAVDALGHSTIDPVTWVSGQWTVPDVAAVGSGTFACATWIGIDGAPVGNSTDILQAGTTHRIDGGSHRTSAWWEWLPNPAHEITSFPVHPGDVVFCLICAPEPTGARIYLTNITTCAFTAFPVTTDGGSWELTGDSAEWILENPELSGGGFAKLPRFGDVYFDDCIAGTRDNRLLFGGDDSKNRIDSWITSASTLHSLADPVAETDRLIKIHCRL